MDAIVAYHSEVAKQSGFTKVSKKSLELFGILTKLGWSILTDIKFKEDLASKEAVKAFGGTAIDNLFNYGAKKLGLDWKPVCFGNWYKEEIAQLLKDEAKEK
jgi:hypothetical protein